MWRALVFIGLLCVAAFGAVWLAEQPGSVAITFAGYAIQTTVAVAVVGVIGIGFALALLWSVVNALIRLPARVTFASRARRRSRGYQAVSRGMVAVGAGDSIAARRYAGEAERLLGEEPLTLLLKAQAAQVSGNRAVAETAFARMMDDPETRVLGLRGLFVEARRRGDPRAALQYANEAARIAPAATWASDAVMEARCAAGDWRGAIAALERRQSLGLIDKATLRRQRAVLLTADALDRQERDPHGSLQAALDAVKLAPDLVPAAALAGRLLSHRGDLRKAARIVEAAWKSGPHPDLADAYLNLRPGDSGLDRLKRAETLAKHSSWDPEARIAVARAAMEAREFARARSALEPLTHDRPTMRVCLLMADLEQAEHGRSGRSREWVARASRARRDPAWIADGVVSDRWAPISPVSGRLDAFQWQSPPDVLVAPELPPVDDVTGDLDEGVKVLPPAAPPMPEAKAAPVEPTPEPVREEPVAVTAKPAPVAPAPLAEPLAAAPPTPEPPAAEKTGDKASDKPFKVVVTDTPANPPAGPAEAAETAAVVNGEAKPRPNGAAHAEVQPVIFPVDHAPDDPGPKEPKPARRKLFR
ncbi:MAG TPA: heme biosynthesis HemY N-terminal domain-containing protein [Microvirga sp.]|jgi:HemY protein|nr:heme biosynthesis HemY N-terminal domain-containing protein [Microvirga sp.]